MTKRKEVGNKNDLLITRSLLVGCTDSLFINFDSGFLAVEPGTPSHVIPDMVHDLVRVRSDFDYMDFVPGDDFGFGTI